MISRLQNPLLASLLGIILSLGLGLSLTWRTLNTLVTTTVQQLQEQKREREAKRKGWDWWTVEIDNLRDELKERTEMMKKRAEQLDQREARIQAGERELAKVRSDLDAIRKDISNRVVEMSADEQVNLKKLAQTYAALPPTAAVAIIKEMDDTTAVKILSLMKSDEIGPIFEAMSKTAGAGTEGPLSRRAAVLSEKIRLMKASKPAAP